MSDTTQDHRSGRVACPRTASQEYALTHRTGAGASHPSRPVILRRVAEPNVQTHHTQLKLGINQILDCQELLPFDGVVLESDVDPNSISSSRWLLLVGWIISPL